MGIPVTCSQCKKSLNVKEKMAGKRGKCPGCGAPIDIPALAAATATTAQQPSPAAAPRAATIQQIAPPLEDVNRVAHEVLGSFRSKIPPVEVEGSYHLGVMISTAVMCLLPMTYLLLIGLLGLCIVLILYAVGVNVVGVAISIPALLMLLFLLKPLVVGAGQSSAMRTLDRRVEPLLFAFVDRVCETVDAPKPAEIVVDCEVNAGAGLRSAFGQELLLHLGLPLIAGLSLQQFANVLAHEFGHFTQDAGMRTTRLVRVINRWFARVVYQRDALDRKLYIWSHTLDPNIAWIFRVASFFAGFSRLILKGLMMLGHLLCGYLERQMEFDADRFGARLAGSGSVPSTLRQTTMLDVATQAAENDLWEFYKEGRLGDNYPMIIMSRVQRMPPDVVAKVDEALAEEKTSVWDSHPCFRARTENAMRENAPGVFFSHRPASALFSDFAGLSRAVTFDYYRDLFGPKFDPSKLHSTEALLYRQSQVREADKTLDRYFQGLSSLRLLKLPITSVSAPPDSAQMAAQLRQARERMLAMVPQYRIIFESYRQAQIRQHEAEGTIALLRMSLAAGGSGRGYYSNDLSAAEQTRRQAEQEQERIREQLEAFERVATARLCGALTLLFAPDVAARVANAAGWQVEVSCLLPLCQTLSQARDQFIALHKGFELLDALLESFEQYRENSLFISTILQQSHTVVEGINGLRRLLWLVPYPFEHGQQGITVGQYLLQEALDPGDPIDVYYSAREALGSLRDLEFRVLARLTAVAEQVEAALQMPPLPEPPPPMPETPQPFPQPGYPQPYPQQGFPQPGIPQQPYPQAYPQGPFPQPGYPQPPFPPQAYPQAMPQAYPQQPPQYPRPQ